MTNISPPFNPSGYMELCGPNMSERGGPLCQVKQLPHHSAPLCRLQASGHHMHNLPHLTHQPWVNHPAPTVACRSAAAIRHRVNGAMMSRCSSQERAASRLGEEAALAPGVSTGKVLVTGGGGYFGSRLGRVLVSQGMPVILVDINKPPCDIPEGAIYCQVWVRGDGPDSVVFSCKFSLSQILLIILTISLIFKFPNKKLTFIQYPQTD